MSHSILPPDCSSLLPPLLACLPTGFASPRPPPALLPLLSPILRQRVQLLSASSDSPSDSWLPLLCWKEDSAEKLASIVESDAFELHPVSGEIEYGETSKIIYRQLDEETLQARVEIPDLGLVIIYLWCQGDQEGGGDGWRVSELLPLAEEQDVSPEQWWTSIEAAQVESGRADTAHNGGAAPSSSGRNVHVPYINGVGTEELDGKEEDNDDDYWAQYDKTPGGRTPAPTRSPMPGATTAAGHARSTSEAEYFEQYSQVQPEMDNDDPSQDADTIGQSSLNGNILTNAPSQPPSEDILPNDIPPPIRSPYPASELQDSISQPRATSPTADSETVSRLEDSAMLQSSAEAAIRTHVSTSIKSLFRLCRASGIDRPEFDEMVKTELETLSMLTEDD